ncbi:protein rough sheath 2 homolog [Juglans microcarpa x Juglans regia]|uniref:protein rough sheath 2 homolog n=1 Tax=Juglans microcarpa x Juglans regia TaxID=2249226 RepID=UPI001B7ECB65|nr:protein rough sheath 2 homolog [Juglans microcarpa x Juglans regia]
MKERQRWQPEEDALLRAYVKQYGPKEWNLVSQRMGQTLHRDPKSCLERWKNYLKPGLKKGSLTPEEQSLVISLQAKYGNKWKKIAAEVPGRTPKRLGKWWEVFKEKQLKQQQQNQKKNPINAAEYSDCTDGSIPVVSSQDKSAQGPYDHILETFAEKYVLQPKFCAFQSLNSNMAPVMPGISVPDPSPVLSLGSATSSSTTSTVLPSWMNMNPSCTTSSSTTSSTPSPSVSLSLSPSEPVIEPDSNPIRLFPGQQVATLIQYCKELEEGRQSWVQHKKEATWRLSRLEQQLESEKARKRREKTEEIEAKISSLREDEMVFLCRIESEYKEELNALHRDAECKEAKLAESWCSKHTKLAKLVEQIGLVNSSNSHGCTALH